MAKILVIAFSPLARDPRVTRQVKELSLQHEITVAGFGVIDVPVHRSINLNFLPRTKSQKILAAGRILRFPPFFRHGFMRLVPRFG